jgi:hypothetical protein
LSRFIIPTAEVERRWLDWWSYLVPSPGTVLGLSPFGDWFLAQASDQVWRLDLLEGSFEPLGVTTDDFWRKLTTVAAEDEWLQVGHVMALEQRGLLRMLGQCYTYRVPPRIGGVIRLENMALGPIGGYQLFCSQLHQQLDKLPPGAVVTKLEYVRDGWVRVRWRGDA